MNGVSPNGVFCDFANVSFGVDDPVNDAMLQFITDCGYWPKGDSLFVGNHDGSVYVRSKNAWVNYSFSGGFLEYVRRWAFSEFVHIIHSAPHNVTKVDLATDRAKRSGRSVREELLRVKRLARSGVALSRKSVPPHKVTALLAPREWDQVETGTVYVGHRKTDRISLRVYDKGKQLWDTRGVRLGEEIVRYEITAGKGKPCLRDIIDPDPLFWLLMPAEILPPPSGVPPWEFVELQALHLPPPPQLTTVERAKRIIERSPELRRLAMLLADANPATEAYVRKLLNRELDSLLASCRSRRVEADQDEPPALGEQIAG